MEYQSKVLYLLAINFSTNMILIIESGATKTDWCAVKDDESLVNVRRRLPGAFLCRWANRARRTEGA